ncbi:hypothetical protein PN487_04885 [Microcystis aeruginosa CS-556/03]|nr:hypothetical protein [Microcystis aeruginosa]MDB9415940.1 hypothetical protein [Microcystis aeruginosa CS-556/03]
MGFAEKGLGWGQGFGFWLRPRAFVEVRSLAAGVNYLIFRAKVPKFSPRSLPYSVLFDFHKV